MAKASSKAKALKEKRTRLEWALLLLLLALILYLLLATLGNWWPFSSQYGSANLGTAFYTAEPDVEPNDSDNDDDLVDGDSGNTGNNGGGGSDDGNGSGGSNNGGGGSGTTTPSGDSALLNFAAGVDRGDTKQQVSGEANGLNERCTILVNSKTGGKQEVCTYTEGDKIVTVTYLDDNVVSASRSGF